MRTGGLPARSAMRGRMSLPGMILVAKYLLAGTVRPLAGYAWWRRSRIGGGARAKGSGGGGMSSPPRAELVWGRWLSAGGRQPEGAGGVLLQWAGRLACRAAVTSPLAGNTSDAPDSARDRSMGSLKRSSLKEPKRFVSFLENFAKVILRVPSLRRIRRGLKRRLISF